MEARLRTTLVAVMTLVGPTPMTAQGELGRVWNGDCGTAVVVTNTTGATIGALWIALGPGDGRAPVEIAEIEVHDLEGGRTWNVDDDEDGDDDDPGEDDTVDLTPRGEPTGWHRVQAQGDLDGFAPGERFRLRLCGENGTSLFLRPILIRPVVKDPAAVGGDGGTLTIAPTLALALDTPDGVLSIDETRLPPIGALEFSFPLRNDTPAPIACVEITAPQAGSDVVDVVSGGPGGGGSYDAPTGIYTFATPLQPTHVRPIDLTLDMLQVSGVTIVAVHVDPPAAPVPALGSVALAILVVGGVAGALLLARPRG